MPIRLFKSDELPPEVPGAIFTDGETTVVLYNDSHLTSENRTEWLRQLVNDLLSHASDTSQPGLRAVV